MWWEFEIDQFIYPSSLYFTMICVTSRWISCLILGSHLVCNRFLWVEGRQSFSNIGEVGGPSELIGIPCFWSQPRFMASFTISEDLGSLSWGSLGNLIIWSFGLLLLNWSISWQIQPPLRSSYASFHVRINLNRSLPTRSIYPLLSIWERDWRGELRQLLVEIWRIA